MAKRCKKIQLSLLLLITINRGLVALTNELSINKQLYITMTAFINKNISINT